MAIVFWRRKIVYKLVRTFIKKILDSFSFHFIYFFNFENNMTVLRSDMYQIFEKKQLSFLNSLNFWRCKKDSKIYKYEKYII